jgi:hypothetical protein
MAIEGLKQQTKIGIGDPTSSNLIEVTRIRHHKRVLQKCFNFQPTSTYRSMVSPLRPPTNSFS